MMPYPILQFVHLENLLAELDETDVLRLFVLEKSRLTRTSSLTWQEITILLCVRVISTNRQLLTWHYPVDTFGFYTHQGAVDAADSPERERYEDGWLRARQMQADLAARLGQDGYSSRSDGLLELELPSFIPGTTTLIPLPARPRRG